MTSNLIFYIGFYLDLFTYRLYLDLSMLDLNFIASNCIRYNYIKKIGTLTS